jgi:hypothetical protein
MFACERFTSQEMSLPVGRSVNGWVSMPVGLDLSYHLQMLHFDIPLMPLLDYNDVDSTDLGQLSD